MAVMTYRVWKCFADPLTDVAVLVNAESATQALETGKKELGEEDGFGTVAGEKPIGWEVEQVS